jgi:DNA-binding MarR family transcriptional regulator
MPDRVDDVTEKFVHVEELLVRLNILRRQSRYRHLLVEGTGLDGRITTMRLVRVVDDLVRTGVKPSVREVAERLVMEHSNTSRAIDQAIEQDLIIKQQSPEDARRVELKLSSKGKRSIKELNARRSVIHGELTRGWTHADVMALSDLLERLCEAYERVEA